MKTISKLRLTTAALVFSAGMAMAAVSTDQVVADLQGAGYTWIELKKGPTQIKVEAVKGTEKVEMIIDLETGAILKREVETADASDVGRSGVKVRETMKDFLDDSDDDDEEEDDSDEDDDDDNDDDDGDDDGGDDEDDGDNEDDDEEDDDDEDEDEEDDDDDDSGEGNSKHD